MKMCFCDDLMIVYSVFSHFLLLFFPWYTFSLFSTMINPLFFVQEIKKIYLFFSSSINVKEKKIS